MQALVTLLPVSWRVGWADPNVGAEFVDRRQSLACAGNRTRFSVLQAVVSTQTELLRLQTQQQCRNVGVTPRT
jgi:hypothetical protein